MPPILTGWRRSPLTRGAAVLALLAASLTVSPASPAAAAVTDGLALWYKLDETSGSVATDSSGNNRNGTVNGTAGWSAGRGLAFNGTDTFVKAPDDLLAGLDSITVAVDVLIDPAQSGAYFVYGFGNTNAGTGHGDGYLFGGGNRFRASISNANWTGEQNTEPDPGRDLARGTFKHVTYTQTGTTGILYEDGAEVGRNTDVTLKPSAIGGGSTAANYLGKSLYSGDGLLKGRIRDFRVYQRAITAGEVAELAAASAAQGVAQDKAALTLGDTSEVTANLALPAAKDFGSTITYLSSNPSVLGNDGKVTRPAAGRPDETATLTATLKRGAARQTKDFTVKVLAQADDSTKVNRAARALVVPNVNDVRGNLTLPATGADETTVSWTSDRPGVIGTNGVVHRPAPGAESVRVNLIATVKLNQASSSRTFEALVPPLPAPQALKGYLFSYFTGEREADGEQLYAALSRGNNPLEFRELNAGRPVLTSTLGEKGLRDPFIIRSPEGDKFYQIATDLRIFGNGAWDAAQRTGSKSIMVWESTDLVTWTDQRLVKVSPDTAGNTWAPEAYYDDDLGAYVVFWASKIYPENDPNHTTGTHNKMMYATTRDFVTFSTPKVWVDPGYSVIDSTIIKKGDTYYRFTKDERNNTSDKPCSKFIIAEKSTSILDPAYAPVAECIGKGALSAAEGPTVFKSNTEDKWYLFLDEFGGRGYLPFESTDMKNWSQAPAFKLPASPRHGTVLPITQAEYDRLLLEYLPAELVESAAAVTVRTKAGTAPQLPATVAATFADGSAKKVPVTWDAVKPADYASAGTFVVRGDIAESGTVKARATVTVLAPDAADAGGDVKGTEGSAIPLDGTSAGDGTVAWTYRPAGGADAGAACAFADATSANTTFTCTDDGTYGITLKVGDVTDTATVTVSNAAPRIGAVTAPATAAANRAVKVTAAVRDPGSNDTLTCQVEWGDGATTPGTIADGTCAAAHTYPDAEAYDAVITVSDDDGDQATAKLHLVVNPPPGVNAGPDATGAEGSAIPLTGLTTGTARPAWSYRPLSGVDTGATCEFADAKAAATTITCTDDGTYEVRLTVGKAKDKARVTVVNAIPVITGARNPASVEATFTDAGKHDTHTCTVDWTGGVKSTGTVANGKCTAGHTYTKAGTYRVTVSVFDDDGGQASRTVRVVVKAAGGGGSLPLTGSPVALGAGFGLLLLIGGAVLLVLGRRRGVRTEA
ncbi:immunoglobulin-like domain-containing protein [Actinoplanes sp. ATCC 53533]|uniref:immunoglobulin-like domain-containing protein n=1 Tax=Actinoplanes sp. ATCC 53533 TaxID=1288362 RepID=UPI0018F6963F|nr:immunoglobulin-like domain-containing protein [Actinoplanes sp. ATCC 53533]